MYLEKTVETRELTAGYVMKGILKSTFFLV